MAKNIEHLQHIKSNVVENGNPKLPTTSVLVEGELAVNYADGVETISLKNTNNEIVRFSSDDYYTEQKLGSGFTGDNSAKTVTDVIVEDEKVISTALNDLEERKVDIEDMEAMSGIVFSAIQTVSGQAQQAQWTAQEAKTEIAQTTMRVYRNGGYNMNECLWYGWWFGCTLGRPNPSASGEEYALMVVNSSSGNTVTIPLIDVTQSVGHDWSGTGTYTIQGETFAERYFGGYPQIGEEIASSTINFGASGHCKVVISIAASNTRERDTWIPEPTSTQGTAAYIVCGSFSGGVEFDESCMRLAISDLSYMRTIEFEADTDANGSLTIKLYNSDSGNYGNWFVYRTEQVFFGGQSGYMAIKQVCHSSFDSSKTYQRMVYTKDRNVFTPPTTYYESWQKCVKDLKIDYILDNTTSASTNPVATSAVYQVINEDEEIVSSALNDLNERKLDVSAYTPVDINNYYTKSETSAKTEISSALQTKANANHNQASNTITAMTNYAVASESGSILTSDSLNVAIGKLEKRLNDIDEIVQYLYDANETISAALNDLNTRVEALEENGASVQNTTLIL